VIITFKPKKSAQAAAILLRLNGGEMDQYLFIKMLYLGDREAMGKWGESITGDSACSMPLGPVLSNIYDLTKGDNPSCRSEWEPFISDADDDGHRVSLKADPDTDELCKAEIKILTEIFTQFKDVTFTQIKNYTHSLREYEKVGRSSKPILPETILRALGKTEDQIKETRKQYAQVNFLNDLLAAS